MVPHANIHFDEDSASLRLGGAWTLAHYAGLRAGLARWKEASATARQVDMSELHELDTAGAALLAELFGAERLLQLADRAEGLSAERRALLRSVARALQGMAPAEAHPRQSTLLELLERIGRT